jgi:protoporphyrin/coproporphyrin ferrochelatase
MKPNLYSERQGAILLNLGTPDSADPRSVRRYLKEFLMDPYVLDIPWVARWLLVHGAILPKRSYTSAAAYEKIWGEKGSPLLAHLLELSEKVQEVLKSDWVVRPAMRYGRPSIRVALEGFKEAGVKEITLLPLYPQYSLAATESSIQKCKKLLKEIAPDTRIRVTPPFYQHSLFIESFAQVAEESLKDFPHDHLLFSFHGLPERQVKKTDLSDQYCLTKSECCAQINNENLDCYRAQCYRTAELLAQRMKLASDRYSVCFQSRLGRTPWIKPYTDEFYRQLPKQGVKRLAVMCPAFVADCLETLEEVQIRGKEEFIRHGGEDLKLVPSLNASDFWAKSVSQILQA